MTLVLEHEVVPGLVAFADPEVMHAANVCRTNMPHEHVLRSLHKRSSPRSKVRQVASSRELLLQVGVLAGAGGGLLLGDRGGGDRRHYVDDGRGYHEIRAFEGCNKNPYRLLTRSPEAAT